MNNLEKFSINPTNEFHILRHFEFVKDNYKKSLINKPYYYWNYSQEKYTTSYISENDIEYALETIGTKFHKNITNIENPKKLLELIRKRFIELNTKKEIKWTIERERGIFAFSFEYSFSVGAMNCLSLGNLSKRERKNIKSVFRSKCAGEDSIMVDIISGIKLQSTKMIYVEIVETNQLPFFAITAFPDCSANNLLDDNNLVFALA